MFHQLLQSHNMLSARLPVKGVPAEVALPNMHANMFADGVFHGFCWLVVATGIATLWRAASAAPLVGRGYVFLGAFLASGVLLMLLGRWVRLRGPSG